MSGHSKWATTKRAKAANDAKRGAIFTKVSNLISIAARHGGDPETNFTLRMAIDKAKSANMPKDNIERAIKRGTGELAGQELVELIYEALGPGQSQLIIKCVTDNRNRTAANIRHLLDKHGGSLGAVAWNFEPQGVILIKQENLSRTNWDDLELSLIDLDVLDIKKEAEGATIYTKAADLRKIKQFLEKQSLIIESAELDFVAKDKKIIERPEDQAKFDKLIEALEENDDVSSFNSNIE